LSLRPTPTAISYSETVHHFTVYHLQPWCWFPCKHSHGYDSDTIDSDTNRVTRLNRCSDY